MNIIRYYEALAEQNSLLDIFAGKHSYQTSEFITYLMDGCNSLLSENEVDKIEFKTVC